jgi:hypothetical protein
LGFIEIADLLSGGKTSTCELVRRLVERYRFAKFPTTVEELDVSNGVEFFDGTTGEIPISKFVIWDSLLVLETRIDTNASKCALEELLNWGAQELGLNYEPGTIQRFGFISDVSFFSDVPILEVNPAVKALANACSEQLSRIWMEPVKYEPFTVRVGHDPTSRKYAIAPFVIEHRANSRFSENKYFSEAPLPTEAHWTLLEEFERNMVNITKPE